MFEVETGGIPNFDRSEYYATQLGGYVKPKDYIIVVSADIPETFVTSMAHFAELCETNCFSDYDKATMQAVLTHAAKGVSVLGAAGLAEKLEKVRETLTATHFVSNEKWILPEYVSDPQDHITYLVGRDEP